MTTNKNQTCIYLDRLQQENERLKDSVNWDVVNSLAVINDMGSAMKDMEHELDSLRQENERLGNDREKMAQMLHDIRCDAATAKPLVHRITKWLNDHVPTEYHNEGNQI